MLTYFFQELQYYYCNKGLLPWSEEKHLLKDASEYKRVSDQLTFVDDLICLICSTAPDGVVTHRLNQTNIPCGAFDRITDNDIPMGTINRAYKTTPKQFVIKKSNIKKGGYGVYAKEMIKGNCEKTICTKKANILPSLQ